MYGINYSSVIGGRIAGAASAVAQAPGRMSNATKAGLNRAKSVSSKVAQTPTRMSQATKSGLSSARSASGRIAKTGKGKVAMFGGAAAFGSYLVGGRRGRGVDKTSGRPTGMYKY